MTWLAGLPIWLSVAWVLSSIVHGIIELIEAGTQLGSLWGIE